MKKFNNLWINVLIGEITYSDSKLLLDLNNLFKTIEECESMNSVFISNEEINPRIKKYLQKKGFVFDPPYPCDEGKGFIIKWQ